MVAMPNLRKNPKTGMWEFRRAVPPDIREALSTPEKRYQGEIKKSFGTPNKAEALPPYHAFAAEVDRLFQSARNGVEITMAQAEALAEAWKAEALGESAEQLALDTRQRSPEELERYIAALDAFGDADRQDLARRIRDPIAVSEAKAILAKQGLALPEDSKSFRRLAFALQRVFLEIGDINTERQQGVWNSDRQGPVPVVIAPELSPLVLQAQRGRRVPGKPDATLLQAMERWKADKSPRPKTLIETRAAIRRFNEVAGGEPVVRDINKAMVVAFLDALRKTPTVMTNAQRKLPLPKLLELFEGREDVPRAKPATVRKMFSMVSTVVERAKKYDFVEGNPFDGLRPQVPDDGEDDRDPLSADDLKALFERSPLYCGSKSAYWRKKPGDLIIRDEKFWLPLLGLWTGARLDELGQLLLSDIRVSGGVTYFDLNKIGEGKRLKNKGSKRRVPIHPELIRYGFLSYVDGLRRSGQTQVFPSLRPDNTGSWTSAESKWLNGYLDSIGIDDPRKVIHSLRHNFKDAMRGARIDEEIRDYLEGHSSGKVGRGYGEGFKGDALLGMLAEAVDKITYPINLRHLYVSD